jgi:putative ABC transport system substrate-binding protein
LEAVPDALWLLPDLTVISPETVEFLFNYSMAHKIPVIAFSEQYLALGAFMSISLDVYELGRQTGEMANTIFGGKPLTQIPPAEAQKTVVTINRTVAGNLGIPIHDAALNGIRIVD